MSTPNLPPRGQIISSIRTSCRAAREAANIQIHPATLTEFLTSPLFLNTFHSLSTAHGVHMPLKFPSVAAEVNLVSILSLLNFAHGYRVPLRRATGRGAYDSIRALMFSLYLSSDSEASGGGLMSAKGMCNISSATVADLMQLTNYMHVERPHPTIPALTVGQLDGPLYELVGLVTKVLNETGGFLVKGGYPDLGSYVLEALKEGERVGHERGVDVETVLNQIIQIPGFQDVGEVKGQPVYIFKKALFLLHALVLRFTSADPTNTSETRIIPLPDTTGIPVFSDNVLPSMLVHLGALDVSESAYTTHRTAFAQLDVQGNLTNIPTDLQGGTAGQGPGGSPELPDVEEGPVLNEEEAYALRAAAVDVCEVLAETARKQILGERLEANNWVKNLTLPELDGWLWAVAKKGRLRSLNRFSQPGTVMY